MTNIQNDAFTKIDISDELAFEYDETKYTY